MVTMRPPFRTALRVLLMFVMLWAAWQIWYRFELRRYQQTVGPIIAQADKPAHDAARLAAGDDASRYYAAAAIAELTDRPADPTPIFLVRLVQRLRTALIDGTTVSTSDGATATQVLRQSEVPMALADRAARLPFGRYATGTMFRYRTSGLIRVYAALTLRTIDAIRAGDAAGAGEAIYSRVRLMRALEDQDGSFVPPNEKARQMSDLAPDIGLWLELEPPDSALQQVADALEEPYRSDDLGTVLARRARSLGEMNAEDAGRAGMLAPLILRRNLPSTRATAAAMDAVRVPWPQRLDAVKKLSDDRQYVSLGTYTMTVNMAHGIASNRAARLAIAAEQGRRAGETGSPLSRAPHSGDASVDPFTGAPLHFVTSDAGFVVYSVGLNGTDDGGALDLPSSSDAPNIPQATDVGVRVRFGRAALASGSDLGVTKTQRER